MVEDGLLRALADGRVLAWSLHLGDELLGYSWLALAGREADGALRFMLMARTRSALLGDDVQATVRASLLVGPDLTPRQLSLRAGSRGVDLLVTSTAVEAELTDGTRTTVEAAGLAGFLDHTLPGLHAVLLARLAPSLEAAQVFLVQQLLPVTYRVSLATDGATATTSLREELELSRGGLPAVIAVSAQRFRAALSADAPAPPNNSTPDAADPLRAAYRPPPGAGFVLQEVELPAGPGPIPATVTVPSGSPPHPAVLFVPGSGGADRHGIAGRVDSGAHEIMDALAESGFLGLRYDKRGTGSTSLGDNLLETGFESRVEEARAAMQALVARPDVDPQRVAVVGHSEGGTVALVLAAEGDPVPAAVALLATPGRRIDEVIVDQLRWQGRELGLDESIVEEQIEEFRTFVEHAQRPGPWDEKTVPAQVYAGLRQRRWYVEQLQRVPAELVCAARCPVLVCHGMQDRQVSADRDALLLERRAREAGVPVRLRTYAGLDHLLKPATDAGRLRDYGEPRAVDAGLLADLAGWLHDVLRGTDGAR